MSNLVKVAVIGAVVVGAGYLIKKKVDEKIMNDFLNDYYDDDTDSIQVDIDLDEFFDEGDSVIAAEEFEENADDITPTAALADSILNMRRSIEDQTDAVIDKMLENGEDININKVTGQVLNNLQLS